LLFLIIAAERARHAATPQRVEFINENDAGRRAPRLLEQVADPRRTNTDEHLDELGPGNGKEGHSSFAGHRAREQRLSGARRADRQHALGDARTEAPERFRVAQEGHDLLKLVFRLVYAGNVAERHPGVGFDINLGARFADCHQAAMANGVLIHPDQVKDEDRQPPGQDRREQVARRRAGDLDAMRLKFVGEVGVDAHGVEQLSPIGQRLLERALDGVGSIQHVGDLVIREQLIELAVGNGLDLRVLEP
jgi:hypothetical protein